MNKAREDRRDSDKAMIGLRMITMSWLGVCILPESESESGSMGTDNMRIWV